MLKRLFFAVIIIGGSAILSGVQAQQRVVADKVVAVVGNSAILYSEVDEMSRQILQQRREAGYTLDRDARVEALENLMMQKLLYNQAQIDSVEIRTEDIPQAVDNYIQNMVDEKGSLEALEAFYNKTIYEIKDELRMRYEEMRYAQSMQYEIQGKVTITPGEVEKFYKKIDKDSLPIIPEQYVYAHLVKYPASSKLAKQRVREDMLALRERIMNGERLRDLARMYSVDGSAFRGGEMDPMPREGFVKPFGDALAKLKPGQISEVVETEYGFHIIELIEVKGNQYRARHILKRPVFTDAELEETLTKVDSLVKLVREGELTFEKAVAENSDDPFSRYNSGLVSNHEMVEMYGGEVKMTSTKFFKEDLEVDFEHLNRLKVGEVSNAYLTSDMKGNVMAKAVKLLEIIPAHKASLKEDYLRLEEIALEDKQNREFRKWLDAKIEGMYVRIEPEFRTDDFDNKAWLK